MQASSNPSNPSSAKSSAKSPSRLDYNYVLECFRPNAKDGAPGRMCTSVPGETFCIHRHTHSTEELNPSTSSSSNTSSTAPISSRYVWCPNCTHESTAELNNESKSEQQS